jgi:hypothetical protein
VIAGSVLTGSLLLVRSAEDAGVQGALSSMTADRVDVDIRILDPESPVAGVRSAVDSAIEDALGTGIDWSSSGWVTSSWVTTPDSLYATLVEFDDPADAAELVAGQWPTSSPGVALPESAAASLGLDVGDTLTFVVGSSTVEVRVDALYRALPESGVYWDSDPLSATGTDPAFPQPGRTFYQPVHAVGPLIVANDGIDASGAPLARLEMTAHPEFTGTDVAGFSTLREQASDVETEIARGIPNSGGALTVDTRIAAALGDVDAGLDATRGLALIIGFVLLVVVGAAALAVTRLLVDARAAEFALLRARGASRRQTALTTALDAGGVGILIVLIAPWGGVLLHAAAVSLPPLDASGLTPWVLPDITTWVCAALVGAVVAGLLCASSRPGADAGARVPSAVSVVAATLVIVTAGIMVWRALTIDAQPGDLILAATPAVLVLAIAMIGSRVATWLARPISLLAARTRGAVAPLVGWFAARGSGHANGVMLVALTVATALLVVGVGATWQQAVRDQAAIAVGPAARSGAAGTADGGAPVIRRETLLAKELTDGLDGGNPGVRAQVLAIDAAGREMLDEGVVGRVGGTAIAKELPPTDAPDTGPLLQPGTAELRAEVTLSAPEGSAADVSFVLADDAGILTVVPWGSVTAGATGPSLTAAIAPVRDDEPVRLVAIMMDIVQRAGGGDAAMIELAVDAPSMLAENGTELPGPLALGDAGGWGGSVDDAARNDSPDVIVTDTTVTISASALLGAAPITYGAVGWRPNAFISAVLPTTLADDLDVIDGGTLSGFISGTPVTFLMAGETVAVPGSATAADLRALEAGIPATARAATTIVVDGRTFAHRLVESSANGSLVDELWLPSSAGIVSSAPGGGEDAAVDAVGLGQRMMAAPLRAEIVAAASVAIGASALLGLVGFGARIAAVSRARRLESAQLRAVGLSRRGMIGVASIDAFAIAAVGTAIGLGGGVAALQLVGTRVASGGGADALALMLPWMSVTLLPLGFLLALGAVSVAFAMGQLRLPLAALLRTGSAG